ncbi:hypothetical protein MAPG_05654 [Magnaporthiopsis poae ATCC 64411]|uniref:Uncharacterized protein n=1 Tax=Magnaporthiopsis poae (strain ATCC 64411 / 73-15) TaxID=644358 RepID=A0A0C4DZZ1_MAGP6|nr:hypothetical protein MAPG_05654 [Magnaporthiopsis poae ATCC 64411]
MARSCAVSLLAAGGTLLLFGAAPSPASAFSPRMQYQGREWTPAKPTNLASVTLPGAGDVSPAPTEAPAHPDFGGLELFKRDFTKGTDTCGFAAQYKSAAANGGGGGGGVGAGNQAYSPPAGVSPGQTTVSPVTAAASPQMGQNGYFAVPLHQQQQHPGPGPDGRYPSYYEPPKQQPSPVYSDPRYSMVQPQHTGNSMGGGGGQWHTPPPAGGPQQQTSPPMELASTNPVGSAENRAELL